MRWQRNYRTDGPLPDRHERLNALPMPLWAARLISFGFVAGGVLLLALTAYLFKEESAFAETAIRVKGNVIELIENTGEIGKNDTTYRPVMRFSAADGSEHTFQSNAGFSAGWHTIGQQLDIAYPPGKPQEAVLYTTGARLLTFIPGVIGLVFFGLGGIGVYMTTLRRS